MTLSRCRAAGSQYGETPLHYAALFGYVEVATLLLDCGADKESNNKVSLHASASMLPLSRSRGAGSQDGSTPLHRAALNGKLEVAALLLDRGADKDAKSKVCLSRLCRRDTTEPLSRAGLAGWLHAAARRCSLGQARGRRAAAGPRRGH